MERSFRENENYDEVPEEELAYNGAYEEGPDEYLVQGFSIWNGYETVYEAASFAEAEEVKKLHEESFLYEARFKFYERHRSYRIIKKDDLYK